MQNLDPIEEQAETPESSTGLEQRSPEKREIKETREMRLQAAEYLENRDEKRSFTQTLKSFAAWLADRLSIPDLRN